MKLIALETSSSACSVAIFDSDRLPGEACYTLHEVKPMQQSQLLLPMIDALLKKVSISLSEINAIAYGCGPGSFTGIRLAVSTAQALGYGLNIPLISISSLEALAHTIVEEEGKDGWKKYTHIFQQADKNLPKSLQASTIPTAKAIIELARLKFKQGDFIEAKNALPNYLHNGPSTHAFRA